MKSVLTSFRQFYPAYLHAHSDSANRWLHFVGASSFFIILFIAFATHLYWLVGVAVLIGYLLPGIGHHFFEHNKSFRSSKPVFCVIGALFLYLDTLSFGLFNRKVMRVS